MSEFERTLLSWQILQVDQDREVVGVLWRDDILAVLALQDVFGTILNEFLVAPDLDGDEDLGLGLGRGDVEGDTVKVGHGLIDMRWGGSIVLEMPGLAG